jgi:hypothetical protein
MKKKVIIITVGVLLAAVLLFGVMPVAASDFTASIPATSVPTTAQAGNGHLWVRILAIKDQATLDALIAKAEANGKINADQATKIESFWTTYHAKFVATVKARILQRLISVKSEANLKTFLDKRVAAGKINADQETTIINMWEAAHATA